MKFLIVVALLLITAPGAASRALRKPNPHGGVLRKAGSAPSAVPLSNAAPDDEAVVKQLRTKLLKITGGISKLFGGKVSDGAAFRKSVAGSMLGKVKTELDIVLQETANMTDKKKALHRLQEANASVQQMSNDLGDVQEDLMHEGNAQLQSLLLGVLVQKQKEPMGKQLDVLADPRFEHLPVVAAVFAANNTKTPLFEQVAKYLDAHTAKDTDEQIPDKLVKGKDGKPEVTPIVRALEARLRKMVTNQRRAQEDHEQQTTAFDNMLGKLQNIAKLESYVTAKKKKNDRAFVKDDAVVKNDIKSMRFAIESIKKGDLTGLAQAQDALTKSMKAAQARSGHIVYLIQLVNGADDRDCPYCVAQCLEKCHNGEGKSYGTCLTTCADAGMENFL